ncbi:MAG TPA: anti-sigma factor [Pyrinomonadaceae bacterium]|nr:anti-sigma factor [Pyrinomonadaceae bacterium]
MTHENYQEMLAAQALNALDPNDAQLLEAHLESCSDCRSQLSDWQNTAAWLSFAAIEARPLEPASDVRSRILQAVRSDVATSVKSTEVAEPAPSPGANVIPLNQKWPRAWTSAQTRGAIAAAVVFVVLGASLFVLWQQNRAARNELICLQMRVQNAQDQLIRLHEAMELIVAPGTRMAELAGTNEMPGAHATLAFDKNGRAILMAKGLPPPPAGKAYQLWFIAGGRPIPGKVFITDPSGAGMLNDQIPADALKAAVFAITLEPESGVQQPTGAMYLKSTS